MTSPNVTMTNADVAMAAVIDRLKDEAQSGVFGTIDIDYSWNGNAGPRQIYGGGWRFTQEDMAAETPGLLVREIVSFALYVRVVVRPKPPTDLNGRSGMQQVTEDAFRIGKLISKVFMANPRMAGNLTWLGIVAGQGDYNILDDEMISTQSYQVQVESYLTRG